ncbi:MAG: hypothetical protein ACI4B5_00910 [Bacteroidaceae bacterium]
MNNKKYIMAAWAAALLTLAGCDEKDYTAYPPTFKGFRIERNGVETNNREIFAPGDSMRVTAMQEQKGRYINATDYYWTLSCQILNEQGGYTDSVVKAQYHTNYDGISNADPWHTFAIPERAQGRATVSFHATYNYSSDGTLVWDGSNIGGSNNYSGSISTTSNLLNGDAQGSFSFNIQ